MHKKGKSLFQTAKAVSQKSKGKQQGKDFQG